MMGKIGSFFKGRYHPEYENRANTQILAHNPRVYFQIVLYGCVFTIFGTFSSAEEMENFMAVFPWFSLPKLQKHFKFFGLVDYFSDMCSFLKK